MSSIEESIHIIKEAAQAVAQWEEASAKVIIATERHVKALEEAVAQEEAKSLYMEARNIDYGERKHVNWSSTLTVGREVIVALQAKREAEYIASKAKSLAEVAVQKLDAITLPRCAD